MEGGKGASDWGQKGWKGMKQKREGKGAGREGR